MTSAIACGGDDDGGSKSSGVSSGKQADQLSEAEAKKLCEWGVSLFEGFEPTKEQVCTTGAVWFSPDQASCEASVQECLEQSEQPQPGDDGDDGELEQPCEGFGIEPQTCTATVAEIEKCLLAERDALVASFTEASCEDAGQQRDEGSESEVLPECEVIVEKCPDDGGSSDGGDDSVDDGEDDFEEPGYICPDGTEIPLEWLCDGTDDCADGDDETGC